MLKDGGVRTNLTLTNTYLPLESNSSPNKGTDLVPSESSEFVLTYFSRSY